MAAGIVPPLAKALATVDALTGVATVRRHAEGPSQAMRGPVPDRVDHLDHPAVGSRADHLTPSSECPS
jgi:hypothetical protein